ncbi:hypothetical protein [Shewanella polaris]|uniref:Uncharacterized protein n=1 Tax=Shewanella polaris TaxID=2588449 RepID=A0A4Y5YG87_9GAMM|nr:hypothetical protein [Shewanella polaris]QDE31526.1 hypothetical protein FH971_11450 [Shewanella polaris]
MLTWPFSHIHVLQGIQASCLSDVSLAFAVQVVLWRPAITTFVNPFTSDVPSEALAFSLFINKMGRSSIQFKLKSGLISVATFSLFENVAGTAGVIQEGIAVDPLLARAGWNLAMLIQTEFEKTGVGEAPRHEWPQAIAVTHYLYNTIPL